MGTRFRAYSFFGILFEPGDSRISQLNAFFGDEDEVDVPSTTVSYEVFGDHVGSGQTMPVLLISETRKLVDDMGIPCRSLEAPSPEWNASLAEVCQKIGIDPSPGSWCVGWNW